MLVPLPSPCGGDAYVETVDAALELLCSQCGIDVERRHAKARLIFGDLHLADIRAWREAELGAKRVTLVKVRAFMFVCLPE